MKAKEITLGLSNLTYHDKKRKYGPTLRFSTTLRVDLEDGRILGDTIPGFIVRKRPDGSFSLWPPVHLSAPSKTYFCGLITQDEADLILGMLDSGGYLKNVGKNADVSKLKDLEPDLLSELPGNVYHV